VNTRCIHLGSEEKSVTGGNIALAPMLDFLNHKCDAKVMACVVNSSNQRNMLNQLLQFECGYNYKTDSFDIRTLMPYRRGQQVEQYESSQSILADR
jgi:hypothetical protein